MSREETIGQYLFRAPEVLARNYKIIYVCVCVKNYIQYFLRIKCLCIVKREKSFLCWRSNRDLCSLSLPPGPYFICASDRHVLDFHSIFRLLQVIFCIKMLVFTIFFRNE